MAGGLVYTAVGSEAMATAEYYGKAMCDLGKEHPEIVALTADLAGSTKIGVFRKEFPERFFNVGIAEQNMFGIAAGMAKRAWFPSYPQCPHLQPCALPIRSMRISAIKMLT